VIPRPNAPNQPIDEQIRDSVRRGRLVLPPLPELATRLIGMLRDHERADLGRVGALIEKDQALAASVLRMANSALFGGLLEVTALGEASARLGLRQITTMVTTVSHRGHFAHEDPERLEILHRLWEHALTVATLSRRLMERARGDGAEAYLAGLLHDVGKLLVLKGVDDIDARPGSVRIPRSEIVRLMLPLHCDLGYAVLRQWKLPGAIAKVALRHHDTKHMDQDALVLRVQAANAMASHMGVSMHPDASVDLEHLPCIRYFDLDSTELARLMAESRDEVETVKLML
jgi:putative nucleotidyltransferase with HDIG domain